MILINIRVLPDFNVQSGKARGNKNNATMIYCSIFLPSASILHAESP